MSPQLLDQYRLPKQPLSHRLFVEQGHEVVEADPQSQYAYPSYAQNQRGEKGKSPQGTYSGDAS